MLALDKPGTSFLVPGYYEPSLWEEEQATFDEISLG